MADMPPIARSVFYPQLVAKVTIRFDEALHAITGGADSTSHNLLPPGPAAVFGGFTAVPKVASIELSTPRIASKFTASFSFRDVPIEPRTVRAIKLEWFLGTVSPAQWIRGAAGGTAAARAAAALQPRVFGIPNDSAWLMTGIADGESVKFDDKTGTLTVEGRDPSGLLMDGKLQPGEEMGLDLRKPLDEVVIALLQKGRHGALLKNIKVVADPSEWDGGFVPSPGYNGSQSIYNRSRMGANGQTPAAPNGSAAGGGLTSYWDLVTQLCQLVGAIPRFNRETLELRRARDVFSQAKGPSPFAGGKPRTLSPPDVANRFDTNIRYFVWGRDLASLQLERKYNGKVVPRILVVSVDETKRGKAKLLQGFWPPAGSPQDELKFENEVLQISRPGIRDPARLTSLARDLYEEIGSGSGSIGGSATTSFLATIGGDNADPDVLRLRPTDAVFIGYDTKALTSHDPVVSELTDSQRNDPEAQTREVARRLGGEQPETSPQAREQNENARRLATIIVQGSRGNVQEMLNFFRVGTVKYGWDSTKGINVTFDFSNYIFQRDAAGPTAQPVAKASGTPVSHAPPPPVVAPQQARDPSPTMASPASTQMSQSIVRSLLDAASTPMAGIGGRGGPNVDQNGGGAG